MSQADDTALPLQLESAPSGHRVPWRELAPHVRFNDAGLIPVITQDVQSNEVVMFAWANAEALDRTLTTGDAWYYSRSRSALWRKGESSGAVQRVMEIRLDCDVDVVLLRVEQHGPACHTGRRSCFYLRIDGADVVVDRDVDIDPRDLYGKTE